MTDSLVGKSIGLSATVPLGQSIGIFAVVSYGVVIFAVPMFPETKRRDLA